MVNFRKLSDLEEKSIRSYLKYFGSKIFDRLKDKGTFLVGEKYRKEVFLVSHEIYDLYQDLKDYKNPYCLGAHLGNMRGNKFVLTLNGIDAISGFTNKKIMLNQKGELRFIYGKSLNSKHIKKIYSDFNRGNEMIIINRLGEVIGLGKSLVPIKSPLKKKIKINNRLDLGWYLRKGY
ncbi:MAG: hypothetical protein GF329_20055 [Candidatus Lokiarchaeota archaeon]|nr:hypothetical protein [Candidatus Lokiarchaeota archaeon]